MEVKYAESGQAGIDLLEANPDIEIVLMDVMMPGDGRLRDDPAHPAHRQVPPAADHLRDREGDEGRPREMPAGRRVGFTSRSRWTLTNCARCCACGSTGKGMDLIGRNPASIKSGHTQRVSRIGAKWARFSRADDYIHRGSEPRSAPDRRTARGDLRALQPRFPLLRDVVAEAARAEAGAR